MKIAIVKYNAGNIQSVLYALERIGVEGVVTDDTETIQHADKVIFPGVGEAGSAMRYLQERGMDTLIKGLKQPVLGICLGMQLMCRHTEEADTACLGIFETNVKLFTSPGLKVPQMGWNQVEDRKGILLDGIVEDPYCYFVHSYYADLCNDTASTTGYGVKFSSALAKDNFYGVQFHAEKSAIAGQQMISNFLKL